MHRAALAFELVFRSGIFSSLVSLQMNIAELSVAAIAIAFQLIQKVFVETPAIYFEEVS